METQYYRTRAELIGEVHARPFDPVDVPSRVLHFGFVIEDEGGRRAVAFHRRLAALAGNDGDEGALRLTLFEVDGVVLRWERHTEFATLTAFLAAGRGNPGVELLPASVRSLFERPPGPLLVATEIAVLPRAPKGPSRFDAASYCESALRGGAARVQTDFRTGAGGFTRFVLIADRADPRLTGVLVRQLLEIETYRTFAMLGLPLSRRLSPILTRIESSLAEAAVEMRDQAGLDTNRDLLEKLTALAADLEAESASGSFRFGATAAYHEILFDRLEALQETQLEGHPTLAGFLTRRLTPAIRTTRAAAERIAELSRRLTRAANLLRTRVDIQLEGQNQSLLRSMDRRARLQLRLQQTVEGLSVAAVSYYVVGLIGYLAKGAKGAGLPINGDVAAALCVPVVMLAVWWLVRRIRRGHSE
ncbi:MAG: DUF3422 family protein [Flavobacteriaceae bacterium]